MLVEIVVCVCVVIFLIFKKWIRCTDCRKNNNCRKNHRKNVITPSKMDFSCESFQKYQYMPFEEFSTSVEGEFNFILDITDKKKRSVLIKAETVQRVYNLACILWQSQESFPNIADTLKEDTHDQLLDWVLNAPSNPEYALIKVAVARLLSSMCSIKPDLYDRALTRLNILNDTQSSLTPYVFRHVIPDDMEGNGDPEHNSANIDLKSVNLSENMFKTLSVISLSCIPAYKLIHSRFPLVLLDLIIDFITKDKGLLPTPNPPPAHSSAFKMLSPAIIFANSLTNLQVPGIIDLTRGSGDRNDEAHQPDVPVTVNNADANYTSFQIILGMDSISLILDFFADLCWQNILRTWVCSERNTVLWERLLLYLCVEVPKSHKGIKYLLPSNPSAKSIHKLEESAINFFSKCCVGHFQNQQKFAEVFSRVLQQGFPEGADPPGMSDFTRRVLMEFIISPGHINVSIETDLPEGMNKVETNDIALLLPPPAFPTSKRHQLLYVYVDRSCTDILRKIRTNRDRKIVENNSTNNFGNNSTSNMLWEDCMPSTSKQLFNESPNSSSGKRSSDTMCAPHVKRTKISDGEQAYKLMFWAPNMYQFINVSQHWSIAEIMQVFVPSGDELEVPVLKFLLSKRDSNDQNEEIPEIQHLVPPPAIQKFLDLEGFKFMSLNVEKKLTQAAFLKKHHHGPRLIRKGSQVPIQAVLAFGLFLRLPEYRNNPETKSMLQAIIGSGKETNVASADLYSRLFAENTTKINNPLTVLPFELLRLTLARIYKNGADFTSLDRSNAPAIDFVLMNLAVFTHQPEKKDCDFIHANQIYLKAIRQCSSTRDKSQKKSQGRQSRTYWPQGVGYSTHADRSKESVDFSRIAEEEELVTILLRVLGYYICPNPLLSSPSFKDHKEDICEMQLMRPLPSATVEQITKSCLLQVIISYLKNDSVFDMVKHIPLYKAILFVLRAMISNVQLAPLILNVLESDSENAGSSENEQQSIPILMAKLKTQIQEFLRRTKTNQPSTSSTSNDDTDREEIIFFEDLLNTADIIEIIKSNTMAFQNAPSLSNNDTGNRNAVTESNSTAQEDYIKIMNPLQSGEYEMIAEGSDGTNYFTIPYHFQKEALQPMVTIPSRMKRLAMEMGSISSSLPISHESAIFIRYDESRLDVMKVLITGPAGTPYMNGCFEFDIFCPSDYPSRPIKMNFQTTGKGKIRFNPNLYSCGKVCLSLLNTWSGEQWNPQTSSILQVLVSIQGMILIPEPYFNEPGWDASRGTPQGQKSSKSYNDGLLAPTIRYAMIDQITSPSACFKKIIHTHFYLKRKEIKKQVAGWINQSTGTVKQNLQAEARHLFALLDKLTLPE